MKIKRKIDAILSQSTGRQLLWLFIITIVLLLIFFAIAYLFFDGFKGLLGPMIEEIVAVGGCS